MPLDNYLMSAAPQDLTTIKNIKESLPFRSGDEKAIARYFRAVEKAVAKYMPNKLDDLMTNIRAYNANGNVIWGN